MNRIQRILSLLVVICAASPVLTPASATQTIERTAPYDFGGTCVGASVLGCPVNDSQLAKEGYLFSHSIAYPEGTNVGSEAGIWFDTPGAGTLAITAIVDGTSAYLSTDIEFYW